MNARPLGLLACLLVLPWSAPSAQCSRGTLAGQVTYVRDGDTIELGEMAIRLQGLAAPEWNEPGGTEVREAMIELVRGRIVRCELDGTRTYDRCVAICRLDGQDVAAALVQQGLARDCPRFSGSRYAQVERRAAAEGSMIAEIYPLPGYCRRR